MDLLIAFGTALLVTLVLGSPIIAFYFFIRECEKQKEEFWTEYYKSKEHNDEI